MIGYIAKRLLWLVLTLWVVFTVTFFLMYAVPGGPLTGERGFPPEVERNLKKRYHLDESVSQQYLRELGSYLRGDLGYPMKLPDFSVNEIIASGFPVSASLGILALVFALTLGFAAGIISAVRRQSWLDRGAMFLATIGIALPDFVIGGVAVLLFSFVIPIFPAAGWGTVSQLILPALCLGAPYAAVIARLTRTGMLDVLSQDYIRTARAKGLPGRAVIFRHALKGAMLPVVSYLGPAISGIITGSLVIENIFFIPGLGMAFIQSVQQKDLTLSMGLVMFETTLISVLNLLADLAYHYLDPRIKLE